MKKQIITIAGSPGSVNHRPPRPSPPFLDLSISRPAISFGNWPSSEANQSKR